MRSRILPLFSPDALVLPENGKQDKVEYSVRLLFAVAANQDEVNGILSWLGPTPYIYERRGDREHQTRIHENFGVLCGWVFRSVNTRRWSLHHTAKIRRSSLLVARHNDENLAAGPLDAPLEIPPPLFAGECDWLISEHGDRWAMYGTLFLSVNPTRFVRHRPTEENLPDGMQARTRTNPPPYEDNGERAFDGADNWLPLSPDLYALLTPAHWGQHLRRYFRGVEEACESELARVCEPLGIPRPRIRRKYNVTYVETYWEMLSPDPLRVVQDLTPYARTFTSRRRGERVYRTEVDNERIEDLIILRIETAPGELLKIYAKTNRRIRMEVVHTLTGEHRFQFPRERDAAGNVRRSSAHTFTSLDDVLVLLERLRTRAATVVNDFLRHVDDQAEIAPSPISAYDALLNTIRAVSNDSTTALEFISLLIHGGGITPGGETANQQIIAALRTAGIIELNRTRTRYVPTADYRHPFQMLREHGSFPLLTQRTERRTRQRTRTIDHHILLD